MSETALFGASSPGEPGSDYSRGSVERYIAFLRGEGIARVVCLLSDAELAAYDASLLEAYGIAFGAARVLHAPLDDGRSEVDRRTAIVTFAREAEAAAQPVAVHCAMGMVRTADVLASWLVAARGRTPLDAIAAVQATGARRQPDATPRGLALLDAMRPR